MNRLTTALIAGFGAAIAILILSLLNNSQHAIVLIMAPFGATAVLVFGLPNSPLAQPKNVIFGHLITAFIGLLVMYTLGVSPYTLALATGLAVACMMISDTTHPPAGANPLLIMLTHQDWTFLVTPVLLGAVIIVITGKIYSSIKDRMLVRSPS
jgi:CBS-domain-containing membrane protein